MAAAQSVTSKKIKAVDLKAAIDAGGPMTIIDMRSSTYYNYGHIPGAINIRRSNLEEVFLHLTGSKLTGGGVS